MKRWEPRGTELFNLVALISTLVSANTSWRYAGRVLHLPVSERWYMSFVLELAFIACAVAMRANVRRTRTGNPGAVRKFLWLLVLLSGYMAVTESNIKEGIGRVAIVILGIVSVEFALGIERQIKIGNVSGTLGKIRNELRERILSRFGLGDDTRTAVMRTRDRAITRAARLATVRWAPFRYARLARAVRISEASRDAIQREALTTEIAALQNIKDLHTRTWDSPWLMEDLTAHTQRTLSAHTAHTQRPDIDAAVSQAEAVRLASAHLSAQGAQPSAQAVQSYLADHGRTVTTAYIRNVRSQASRTTGAHAAPIGAQVPHNGAQVPESVNGSNRSH